jgi:hypothetical protein
MTLKLTPNKVPEAGKDKAAGNVKAGGYTDPNAARFACPVTDLPMNGHYRFSYLRGCGCVLSDKALREIPAGECLRCGAPFTRADVVPLNPPKDEEDEMWAALVAARKVKAPKKRKGERDADGADSKRARKGEEIQGSAAYKSLFLSEDKRRQMEQGESFTARAVHRAYIA